LMEMRQQEPAKNTARASNCRRNDNSQSHRIDRISCNMACSRVDERTPLCPIAPNLVSWPLC
jgi:hypothetical protein